MKTWKCPHCGSDKGTWFSRCEPMGSYCESCGGCCDKPTPPDSETAGDCVVIPRSLEEMLKSKVTTRLYGKYLYSVETIAEIVKEATAQLEKEKRELAAEVEKAKADRNRIGAQVRSELFSVIQKKDEQNKALIAAGNELVGGVKAFRDFVLLKVGHNLTKEKK